MPSMTELGKYIREQRKKLEMSQTTLAARAGLSTGAISMLETGERSDLRADTALRLARALAVSTDDLLNHLPVRDSSPALVSGTA